MRTLLIVGARRPALEAAERLGMVGALLAEPGVGRTLRRIAGAVGEIPFDEPAAALEAAARALLRGERPQAVVPATERAVFPAAVLASAFGLPGLLPEDAACLRDKVAMKQRLRAAGISAEPARPVADPEQARALAKELGLPLVVKARSSSGSRGTVMARTLPELAAAVEAIAETDGAGGAALERVIDGREISVEIFLAEGEVRWSHLTEYLRPGWSNLLPARMGGSLAREAHGLAARAAKACGLGWGMIHVELFLTAGGPVMGEINARPPGGGLMELIRHAYGFDPWEAHLHHLHKASASPLPATPRCTVGNLLIHPGPGVVKTIEGWQEVCALPGVLEAKLRLKPGDRVPPRVGTGQTRGSVIVAGENPEAVVAVLEEAERLLRISLRGPGEPPLPERPPPPPRTS